MSYQFVLQHTGRPFSAPIPEEAWKDLSKHTSLSAARKAHRKALDARDERCGPGAWDDHYRVLPLQNVKMFVELACTGWLDFGRQQPGRGCESHRFERVSYAWPKLTPHSHDLYHLPADWHSASQCEACHQLERASYA